MRYPGHHGACNFSMAGPVEDCKQCKSFEDRDQSWHNRRELVRSGRYTEEVMATAEEIFWATAPTAAPKTFFQSWLETASAPTQSYFAKLARKHLGLN